MSIFAVVAPVASLALGDEFRADAWPPHLTLLFVDAHGDLASFTSAVRGVAQDQPAFDIRGVSLELFGPQRDIRVIELEHSATIIRLHNDLLDATAHFAQPVEPDFTGAGFRPHVSIQPGDEFGVGDVRTLDRLAIVDCSSPRRFVSSILSLAR
jgi:2'-5' RNA ligase